MFYCVSSSNENEVVRAVLNSLFFLFFLDTHKKRKRYKDTQAKAQKRK